MDNSGYPAERRAVKAAGERLQALAGELSQKGWQTYLVATDARRDMPPGQLSLWITTHAGSPSCVVYAVCDNRGAWWLSWPGAGHRTPLDDHAAAVSRAAREMNRPVSRVDLSDAERCP